MQATRPPVDVGGEKKSDPSANPCRNAGNDRIGWNIFRNNAPRANNGILANRHPAQDCRTRSYGCPLLHNGRDYMPICFCLHRAIGGRRTGHFIVDEGNVVSDKHIVLDRHPFTYECMRGNFAVLPDLDAFLDFNESAYLRVVVNFTSIHVDEIEDADSFTKFYIGGNTLKERVHAGSI